MPTFALLTALLLSAAPAIAKETPPAAPPGAERVEFEIPGPSDADCAAQFKRYDANRDGALSYAEYVNGRWGQIRFVQAPSEAEVRSFKHRYEFTARNADKNRDGKLSPAEHRVACKHSSP